MNRRNFLKSMFIFTGVLWIPAQGIWKPSEARMNPAIIGGPVSAGGGTPYLEQSQTTDDYDGLYIYDTVAYGQSFTTSAFGAARPLYSIKVNMYKIAGGSGTLTMRIGTSTNLSSYLDSDTVTVASLGESIGEAEFIFAGQPNLSASTKYWFGIVNSSANWGDRIYLGMKNGGNLYTGGGQYGVNTSTWACGGDHATDDLYFKVYCLA